MNNTKPKYYDEIIAYLRLLDGAIAEQIYEIMKIKKCNVPTYSVFQKTLRKLTNDKKIKRRKVFNSSPTYFYFIDKKNSRKSMLRSIVVNQIIINKNVFIKTKVDSLENVMKNLLKINNSNEISNDLRYINYLIQEQKSRILDECEKPGIRVERLDNEYNIYHFMLRGIYFQVNNDVLNIIILDIENRLLENKLRKDITDLINMLYRYGFYNNKLQLYLFTWNVGKAKQYKKMLFNLKIIFVGQGRNDKTEILQRINVNSKIENLMINKYFGDRNYF